MIAGVAKVVVPVPDQSRAKEFWTDRAGFEVVDDRVYGGDRWIEVASAEGGTVLVLGPWPSGYTASGAPGELPDSPVFFICQDIERTYDELRRGRISGRSCRDRMRSVGPLRRPGRHPLRPAAVEVT